MRSSRRSYPCAHGCPWLFPRVSGACGFSLIELLMAVAIVAILTALAYPSYLDHVRKANRAQAQAFLMDLAQRQQSYLMVHREYARGLTQLGFAGADGELTLPSDIQSLIGAYDIPGISMAVNSGPPPGFNLTLSPQSDSPQSDDGNLCVTSSGARARNCGSATEIAW